MVTLHSIDFWLLLHSQIKYLYHTFADLVHIANGISLELLIIYLIYEKEEMPSAGSKQESSPSKEWPNIPILHF